MGTPQPDLSVIRAADGAPSPPSPPTWPIWPRPNGGGASARAA